MKEKDYLKVIAIKCYDCCGYCPELDKNLTNQDLKEARENVEMCNVKTCSLWEYRLLCKDPFKGTKPRKQLSDEQKEKLRENIKKAQEARRKNG